MAEIEEQMENHDNVGGKVIFGVTTLAVTAGAVALGLALTNKKSRNALKKGTQRLAKRAEGLRETIADGRERVQVFAHRIAGNRKVRKALNDSAKAVKKGRSKKA